VLIGGSTGGTIAGNVITNVSGIQLGVDFFKAQGIWVVSSSGDPNVIGGHLRITGNVIENTNAQLSYGVALFDFGAETEVSANIIRNVNTAGILVEGNSMPVRVEDNVILPGPERFPDPDFGVGLGVWLRFGFGGTDLVRHNIIICENPRASGIDAQGSDVLERPVDGSTIEENFINVRGPQAVGIELDGSVSNMRVARNVVRGSGFAALAVFTGFFPEDSALGNILQLNDVGAFDASEADIFLDVVATNTVLCNQKGSLEDNGTGTRVTHDCR
jgi:hypothetical protein